MPVTNDAGESLYPDISVNYVAEDTLDAGASPLVLDVAATLVGKMGNRGYIVNDGDGDMTIQISTGGTDYNTAWTIKKGEFFDLTGLQVSKIKLTRVSADANYRVLVW